MLVKRKGLKPFVHVHANMTSRFSNCTLEIDKRTIIDLCTIVTFDAGN